MTADRPTLYHLDIELLEDLHTGTGLGLGAVDSTQCVDRDGRPMLPLTVLHGQLRETARRLETQAKVLKPGRTVELFGRPPHAEAHADLAMADGTGRRRLHLGSAYCTGSDRMPLVQWTSTARILDDRRPKTDTLRTAEYIPAGTVLQADCHLHPSDLNDFELVLRAQGSLGADVTRGDGRVRLRLRPGSQRPIPAPAEALDGEGCLVLLLQAGEPLAFTPDSTSGNVLGTRTEVPGQALQGALVADALASGDQEAAQALLDGEVEFGTALQLPPIVCGVTDVEPAAAADALQSIQVRAALLSRQVRKVADDPRLPSWTGLAPDRSAGASTALLDALQAESDDAAAGSGAPKRLGDQHLEWRTGQDQPWRVYRASVRGRQRIRKDPVQLSGDEQDLFTALEIPERTHFLSELQLGPDASDARAKLLQRLSCGWPLWVGRGRRPLHVRSMAWKPKAANSGRPHLAFASPMLRVSVISGLILRGPKLGFIQQWDLRTLAFMLTDAGFAIPATDCLRSRQVFDSTPVRGYNTMSRLPRMAQLAIAQGSTLVLLPSSDDPPGRDRAQASMQALAQQLASRPAWGERTEWGYGRIQLEWQDLHQPEQIESHADTGAADARSTNAAEALAAIAKSIAGAVTTPSATGQRVPTTRSPIQRLLMLARSETDLSLDTLTAQAPACSALLERVFDHAQWKAARADQRPALLALICRWLLAGAAS